MQSFPHATFTFTYQSQGIGFGEWINLLTLCLGPLLAHILIGAPEPVIMAENRPPWLERVCQYNPTSILWRYFIIADRRIRTKHWNLGDMAAANLIIWTKRGWHSPKEIQLPNSANVAATVKSRVSLLSQSSLKTLVVTLQGIQALWAMITAVSDDTQWTNLGNVFLGIAILGLLRLPAALWILDDPGYSQVSACLIQRYAVYDEHPSETDAVESEFDSRFHPRSSAWVILVRFYYLSQCIGLLVLAFTFNIPQGHSDVMFTTTYFTAGLIFVFLVGVTTSIMFVYIAKGRTQSAIIPCLASFWYRSYTFILFFMALGLIIISALETARLPNGRYTTSPIHI